MKKLLGFLLALVIAPFVLFVLFGIFAFRSSHVGAYQEAPASPNIVYPIVPSQPNPGAPLPPGYMNGPAIPLPPGYAQPAMPPLMPNNFSYQAHASRGQNWGLILLPPIVFLFMVLGVVFAIVASRRRGAVQRAGQDEESALMERLLGGLDKMERRMENLETIFDVGRGPGGAARSSGAR